MQLNRAQGTIQQQLMVLFEMPRLTARASPSGRHEFGCAPLLAFPCRDQFRNPQRAGLLQPVHRGIRQGLEVVSLQCVGKRLWLFAWDGIRRR